MSTTLLERPAAEAPAAAGAAVPSAATQYLRFALGADRYAVCIESVREILGVGRMTPLPQVPDFVRGVMNLRGAVVPVIDLGARLGLAPTAIGRRTCIVIIDVTASDESAEGRETTQCIGMLVDAVHEVFDDGGVEPEPAPRIGARIDPDFIAGIVRVRGEATSALALARVMNPATLARLVASAQPATSAADEAAHAAAC